MDVSRRGRFRRVDIGVGIEPEHAEVRRLGAFSLAATQRGRDPGDGAHGDGVIAADDQGEVFVGDDLIDRRAEFAARLLDDAEVARARVADLLGLRPLHLDIAEVADAESDLRQGIVEFCDPQRLRAHADPAASGAVVEGGSENVNVMVRLRHEALPFSPRPLRLATDLTAGSRGGLDPAVRGSYSEDLPASRVFFISSSRCVMTSIR